MIYIDVDAAMEPVRATARMASFPPFFQFHIVFLPLLSWTNRALWPLAATKFQISNPKFEIRSRRDPGAARRGRILSVRGAEDLMGVRLKPDLRGGMRGMTSRYDVVSGRGA